MRFLFLVASFLFMVSAYAGRYGPWYYTLPEKSPFKLKRVDNGVYLQFQGPMIVKAKIAIVDLAKNKRRIYLIVGRSQTMLFPLLNGRKRQNPIRIQLLNSDNVARRILKNRSIKKNFEELTIVGYGEVRLTDFNISAGCGIQTYFSYNYEVKKFHYDANHIKPGKGIRC